MFVLLFEEPGNICFSLTTISHQHKRGKKANFVSAFPSTFPKTLQALFTASKLCLFDLLHSRPGLDAAQVAQEIKASAKGTECLLEACVSLGLLKSIEKG